MRTSWKLIIELSRERLERGEEVEVETPSPAQHVALRSAALKVGYSARMSKGMTILSKNAVRTERLTQHVTFGPIVNLRPQPEWTPLWERPHTVEGHAQKVAAHMYGHYVRYNKQGSGFRTLNKTTDPHDCVRTYLADSIWWMLCTQDLTLEQPSQPTLDRLLRDIYERDAFDQPASLHAIANACARLSPPISLEMFNDTNVVIPLMTPDEAMRNVEALWLRNELHSQPFRQEKILRRREDEACMIYDIND